MLPGAKLSVGPAEEMFPVRQRDWKRIRNRVGKLANPIPGALTVAWACVGVAITAILAWLPWVASYSQLSQDARLQFAWVSPSMVALAFAALLLGIAMFWVNRKIRDLTQTNAAQIVEDMDDIFDLQQP